MKILITGFKPFLGDSINPSEMLVSEISKLFKVESLVLPVEFTRSFEILQKKIIEFSPQVLVMIGQAAGRKSISLEKIGLNWVQSQNADEAGVIPKTGKLLPEVDLALMTRFPVDEALLQLRKSQHPVEVSFSAGAYVCNDLYFRVLNEFRDLSAVFVHVPLLPEQLKANDQRPSLSFQKQLESFKELVPWIQQTLK